MDRCVNLPGRGQSDYEREKGFSLSFFIFLFQGGLVAWDPPKAVCTVLAAVVLQGIGVDPAHRLRRTSSPMGDPQDCYPLGPGLGASYAIFQSLSDNGFAAALEEKNTRSRVTIPNRSQNRGVGQVAQSASDQTAVIGLDPA